MNTLRAFLLLVVGVSSSCFRNTMPCGAIRLETPDRVTIKKNYGHLAYFTDRCETSTPAELTIDADDYSIVLYVRANQDPKVFLGVRPRGAGSFDIQGQKLSRLVPGSALDGLATHWARLSRLDENWKADPDNAGAGTKGTLEFAVLNRTTGQATQYAYRFDVVRCTCVGYDGP